MEQGKCVSRGLVLRTTATGEADTILTVLTPDLGRIAVIAKGARSRRSRYSAACQLLVYAEMTLSAKNGWYYLAEANTLALFDGVRGDIEKLALCAYFAELTEAVCLDETPAPEFLSLLLNALYALDTLQKEPRLVKTAFTWRLLALSGFAPLAEGCGVCGREDVENPMLDVMQGVVHCAGCAGGGLSVPLSPSGLAALRHIVGCEARRLYSFTLAAGPLRTLDQAGETFCTAQLERAFRTLDYYKSILPTEDEIHE